MNRGVVAGVLIVAALALVYFFAWPKLKPYVTSPAAPAAGKPGEVTTAPMAI